MYFPLYYPLLRKPRNIYYDVIHLIRHCWQHVREKMSILPKSKSIFEPKVYIPAFAGTTYEECTVPHNSPRENNDYGPEWGMIIDLRNSKYECPSETISWNELIRQQESMCDKLQITTKLVHQDQKVLVDYDSVVSCHSSASDDLYYDQLARNEKEQTCREVSPEIQPKIAWNEKEQTCREVSPEIQPKIAWNEKEQTCREVSPEIQPKIARNEKVKTDREASQKIQPSWRIDRKDLHKTLKYSTTPYRMPGMPCFRRPATTSGSTKFLSSLNTPQTRQAAVYCDTNLQMQVQHKGGNSATCLPLNNVYQYDINTEKVVNQSKRDASLTVFQKNVNAKRKETKKNGISLSTPYDIKQLVLQFPLLDYVYSPSVENGPRSIPYSIRVTQSCETRRESYKKKSSSALPRL